MVDTCMNRMPSVSFEPLTLMCFACMPTQDLISDLLPRVLPAITEGLQDLDDDVRAVAAAALIPVVDGLVGLQLPKVTFG